MARTPIFFEREMSSDPTAETSEETISGKINDFKIRRNKSPRKLMYITVRCLNLSVSPSRPVALTMLPTMTPNITAVIVSIVNRCSLKCLFFKLIFIFASSHSIQNCLNVKREKLINNWMGIIQGLWQSDFYELIICRY